MSEKDNVDSNVNEEVVVIIDEEDKSIGNDPLNNTKIIFDGKEVKVKRARNVNQTPYYQQQRIAGQPVYVQGVISHLLIDFFFTYHSILVT